MSKLINEDWEHASRTIEEGFHTLRQQHIMKAEYQEWEYQENENNKKPAIIKVEKNKKTNETPYKSSNI